MSAEKCRYLKIQKINKEVVCHCTHGDVTAASNGQPHALTITTLIGNKGSVDAPVPASSCPLQMNRRNFYCISDLNGNKDPKDPSFSRPTFTEVRPKNTLPAKQTKIFPASPAAITLMPLHERIRRANEEKATVK